MSRVARVLLADDHALVRRGVRLILDHEPDLTVVAEAGDGAEALALADEHEIDLAVLDVAMPRTTGLQAARELTRRHPHVRVLLLSMYDNDQYLVEAVRAGASGYVLKSAADQDLVRTCREVLRSGDDAFVYPLPQPDAVHAQLAKARRGERGTSQVLSPREDEVLKLIAEGHSSREIAGLLHISPKTVERHRANILQKLEMRDRTELTRYAIRSGLVEP